MVKLLARLGIVIKVFRENEVLRWDCRKKRKLLDTYFVRVKLKCVRQIKDNIFMKYAFVEGSLHPYLYHHLFLFQSNFACNLALP